jgi:hypothetical protein
MLNDECKINDGRAARWAMLAALTLSGLCAGAAAAGGEVARAKGPLRKHPSNGRYFTDGSGKAVYLTGSHTWNNFQDGGWAAEGSGAHWTNAGKDFDFEGYLKFLRQHHHNFIRLWTPENAADIGHAKPVEPVAFMRTGPGNALDGRPQFDVTRLDRAYFDRLRARVIAAGDQGIYVSIMLFDIWGLGGYGNLDSWKGHPFHASNNVNGINGDPNGDGKGLECHTLAIPALNAAQDAYVRKVVDTVNDLDNVLYEIDNEGAGESKDWQYRLVKLIKEYEARKPKQHPVGLTSISAGTNDVLFKSDADWVSPFTMEPVAGQDYVNDAPAETGDKVVIIDTDHLSNNIQTQNRATHVWVWKSFARGLNPIYMDQLTEQGAPACCPISPYADDVRNAMGHARNYAEKMDLAAMTPQTRLSSTGYCLARAGSEYLVYQPKCGEFTVELPAGTYAVEWFDPATGRASAGGNVTGGAKRQFIPPFDGDAVLYLKRRNAEKQD